MIWKSEHSYKWPGLESRKNFLNIIFFFKKKSHQLLLRQILSIFCFFSKPLLKSAYCSLKWGFLSFIWNLVLYFLILKWCFPHNFYFISVISAITAISTVFKWVFLYLKWKKAISNAGGKKFIL